MFPNQTPWGKADDFREIGEGIFTCSTPSHGGYYVPNKLLAAISPEGRASALKWSGSENWYEEDCNWAYVYQSFPHLFPTEAKEHAQKTLEFLQLTASDE